MKRATLFAIALAACGHGGHANVSNQGGGASTRIDATTAAAAVGHGVEITGLARDAKLSAVVVDGDLIVYLIDRPSWGADLSGQRVIVRGTLERTHDFDAHRDPDGAISQGVTSAGLYAIHGATVEPAR